MYKYTNILDGIQVTKLENNLKKMDIELQKYKDKAKALEAASASQSSKVNQVMVYLSI